MAKIVVTFSATRDIGSTDLEIAERARTEEITAPGTGSLVAINGETVVSIYATHDCYVTVAVVPEEGGGKRRLIPATQEKQFSVSKGSKVRVIAASL